jgi:catechol 2,3-dioxygenase-like lactoylglutathione lyase family enzyme
MEAFGRKVRLIHQSSGYLAAPVPRWGAHGTGISNYFLDPEGNLFEAQYYNQPNEAEGCLLGS